MTRKLGLSCYKHDRAAALIREGEIIAAAQEEQFTRKKHDESLTLKNRPATDHLARLTPD